MRMVKIKDDRGRVHFLNVALISYVTVSAEKKYSIATGFPKDSGLPCTLVVCGEAVLSLDMGLSNFLDQAEIV